MHNHYIILMSHGNFAVECVESAKMLAGLHEHVGALSLHPGDGSDDLKAKLDAMIESARAKGALRIIILTDVLGGTPNNVALRTALEDDNIVVISGFNLPMTVELLLSDSVSDEEIDDLISTAKVTIQNVTAKAKRKLKRNEEEESL